MTSWLLDTTCLWAGRVIFIVGGYVALIYVIFLLLAVGFRRTKSLHLVLQYAAYKLEERRKKGRSDENGESDV